MTSAKVENGLLVTGNIASTNMMCSPELMKQESFACGIVSNRIKQHLYLIQQILKTQRLPW